MGSIEDIRTYARLQLGITGMTRPEFIRSVLAYAVERYGDGQEVKMMAERTARHLWDARG